MGVSQGVAGAGGGPCNISPPNMSYNLHYCKFRCNVEKGMRNILINMEFVVHFNSPIEQQDKHLAKGALFDFQCRYKT